MARLRIAFGERRMSEEFAKLIHAKTHTLPDHWLQGAVDNFIGRHKIPTLQDFVDDGLDFQKREREVPTMGGGVVGVMKAAAARADSDFGKTCVRLITDKIAGRYTPAQWEQAMDFLDDTARQLDRTCQHCNGSGYVMIGGLHRCFCGIGLQRPEKAFGPTKTDGTRDEEYIPIIKMKALEARAR